MSPVSVEVTVRILTDGHVVWERTLAVPRALPEPEAEGDGQVVPETEERVLPLSTSVLSPGLFVPAPA